MTLRIDVEGAGTIGSAIQWESTARLSGAGRFAFSMPASDPAAAWVQPLATVYCYWDATLIGAGVVEHLTVNRGVLQAEGGDLASELAYKMIRYANSTYAATIADGLGALLPAGWTYVNAISGPTDIVSLNVMWDSLLSAVNTLCEMAGLWWHIVGKTLTIANAYGAVVHGLTPVRVTRRVDASGVVGHVYPFGAGDGSAAITMRAYTVTPTAPYTVTSVVMDGQTVWGVGRTDSPGYAAPGRRVRVDFKHVAPVVISDAGLIAAANTLQAAAINYLRTHGTPIVEYALDAAYSGIVRPLAQVALAYRDDDMRINETLVATEVRTRVTQQEQATVGLRLEATARRIRSEGEVVADAIIASRIKAAYPQLGVSTDTIDESTWVDMIEDFASGATIQDVVTEGVIPFRFHPDTTQVQSIVVTRQILPIGDDSSLNAGAGAPTQLEYRLNGAGSWLSMPASVDITAAVVNASTGHPLQEANILNVRGVERSSVLVGEGVYIGSIPAIPSGTKLRLRWSNAYFPAGGALSVYWSSRLYDGVLGDVKMAIPLYSWVTLTSGTYTRSPSSGLHQLLWYPATFQGITGWIFVYALNSSDVTTGARLWSQNSYSANIAVTMQMRNVTLAR